MSIWVKEQLVRESYREIYCLGMHAISPFLVLPQWQQVNVISCFMACMYFWKWINWICDFNTPYIYQTKLLDQTKIQVCHPLVLWSKVGKNQLFYSKLIELGALVADKSVKYVIYIQNCPDVSRPNFF